MTKKILSLSAAAVMPLGGFGLSSCESTPEAEKTTSPFTVGKAIYPAGASEEMNLQVCFPIDYVAEGEVLLRIAGENEYSIYLNNDLVGYGPAKAAHGYHRVDEYHLVSPMKENRILVLLAGYNVCSFDRIKQDPFLQYELWQGEECLAYSSAESVAFLHEAHIQKVSRFSYQRTFSESYDEAYTNQIFHRGYAPNPLKLQEAGPFSFLERKVSYPKLEKRPFALLEKNKIHLDPNKPIHTDRYMSNEKIGIFPQSDWEVDPNRVLSQLVVEETPLPLSGKLQAGESLAYGASASITGFLHAHVQVEQTAEIYLHFDEINGGDDSHIEIDCFRNTTHNIVSYRLLPGEYELTSFLPYSAKYVRISCLSGSLEAKSFAIIALENPDVAISYSFEDERMQKIFDAACNTFRANAVDILTDCPSRERAGWLCDSYFSGQAEALLTGKNLVERNFLENYALYRPHGDVKKGMVPMCYPADFGEDMFIPNWAMFYGIELLSYSRRSGDSELVDLSKANLEGLLQYFEGFENEIGLLEDLENWVFIEWSEANNPESIAGVNLPSNMLYASFLEAVGELLGRPELLQKADSIRAKIREIGFDGTFFADNLIRGKDGKLHPSGRISETCQYYAFFFHTASFEQYPDLFALLRDEFGPSRDGEKQYPDVAPSNAFIGDYLRLAILLEAGYPEKVIEEAVAFFLPMAEQTGTLWEHSFAYGSLNHGFASYITVLLFKAITGEFDDYAYPYAYSFDLPREDGFLPISSDGEARK